MPWLRLWSRHRKQTRPDGTGSPQALPCRGCACCTSAAASTASGAIIKSTGNLDLVCSCYRHCNCATRTNGALMRLAPLLLTLALLSSTFGLSGMASCASPLVATHALALGSSCCCGAGPCGCNHTGSCGSRPAGQSSDSLLAAPTSTETAPLVALVPAGEHVVTPPPAAPTARLWRDAPGTVTSHHVSCLGTRAPPLS